MNPGPQLLQECNDPAHPIASESAVAMDDPRVIQAVEEYLGAMETGPTPDRQEFLARYPEIAVALAKCLYGLEFVHEIAPQLNEAGPKQLLASAPEIQPEGPLGDFRIVREIGRGGMGVVYEAVQISLGRRVALKVLPFAAAMDPKQLQRFKNEAQAAAQLHHTNIVPVFGVGCERGVHYYAMQFIEGQTLAQVIADLRMQKVEVPKQADRPVEEPALPATGDYQPAAAVSQSEIGERQSPIALTRPMAGLSTEYSIKSAAFFRTVANLGVQAAEALEHAHDQGVIHRDIKPANLLVDGRGNLWITDFGLAHCQSQAGLTMSGDLIGTLRYMSPEQALAKRVLIDHRTDIYSLGVTLYEFLTLEPAFSGRDREEVLRQIAFEEPRPPRRLNKPIPVELETIVLKAMEKNPAERYATAQELADDLRRFMEDKPIRAKQPTLMQRAAKWGRRHKTAMVVAAAVLLVTVAGLAVSTWLIWLEKEQTKTALAQVQSNAEQAQQNLNTAYQVLDRFVDTLEQSLPREKELTPKHRQLLEQALTCYEQIAHQHSSDPAVRLKTAEAYVRVGGLHEELDQGEQARAAYEQALAVSLKLVTEFPDDPNYRQSLGRSYFRLGYMLTAFVLPERPEEIEQLYAKALRLQEELVREEPANLDYQQDLGATYYRLGYLRLFQAANPLTEAEEPVRRAVAIRQQLVAAKPNEFTYRQELGMSLGNLGNLLTKTSRYKDAEEVVRQELELRQQLVEDFPAESSARMYLAGAWMDLGLLRNSTGSIQEAVAAFRQELRIRKEMAAEFPSALRYRLTVARCSLRLGDALGRIGSQAEALAAYQETVAICKAILRLTPKSGVAYFYLGAAYYRLEQWQDAVDALEKAQLPLRFGSGLAWFVLAMAHWQLGEWEQARAWYDRAVHWMDQNRPFDDELGRFRVEAAALLGISEQPAPK